jgi:succinate dehydrogenase/fumarate reductase iron-sulfur protein
MAKRIFQIYRYNPDADAKPYMQTLEIDLDGGDRMLLDALVKLKKLDPTLSFRRSCREGICGSDAMNINGKNGLACLVNMLTLPETVVLKPLPGLPVIRDLIVDMTLFFQQYHSIKPYLINDNRPRRKNACKARKSAKNSMAFTNASCALVVRQVVRSSGGILTSSWGPLACFRPTVLLLTAAMQPPVNDWTILRTHTVCLDVPPS